MSKVFKKTNNPDIVIWINGDIEINVPRGNPIFNEYLTMVESGYDPVQVEPVPLEELKSTSYLIVDSIIKEIRYSIAKTADDAEIAGWAVKYYIAKNIIAGNITKTDFEYKSFLKEIEHRQLNETMNDFILKVFKNAATYTFVSSILDGEKYFYKKKIKEATDYEVINNLLLDTKDSIMSKIITSLSSIGNN